jgi:sec-independent protein translocase protein TatC
MSRRGERRRLRRERKLKAAKAARVKMAARQGQMSIWEHLDELRRRLVISIIALLVGTVLSAIFAEDLLRLITAPVENIIATSPTETTSVFFKVSLVSGLLLALPVIMYQTFQYLAPGLERHERRYVLIGAPAVSLSFAAGAAFAVTVLLPAAVPFLEGFMGEVIEANWTVDRYLSFYSNILLWAGIVFETPLVMYILAKLGVVTPEALARARRIVLVFAGVGAAVVTPTGDPINMMLLMIPFLVLYELGILLARVGVRSTAQPGSLTER